MKKLKQICISVLMVLALCLSTTMPAFAMESSNAIKANTGTAVKPTSGEESWYAGIHDVGSFTFSNNNLTPRKLMQASGRLAVYGVFWPTDDIGPIYLTVQIRNLTTGQTTTSVTNSANYIDFVCETTVNSGDVIQIFFDASSVGSNPTGAYRKAYVSYSYDLGY